MVDYSLMGEFNNLAFIDAQNLHLGTLRSNEPWKVDFYKFRTYLRKKYNVSEAYFFLGAVDETNEDMYNAIQKAGFILQFREHNQSMKGKKKGNVDTDIVFSIMKKLYKKEAPDKIILVSGDGDYFRLIKFLIDENRLGKILFPNGKRCSTLYRTLPDMYKDALDKVGVKSKIRLDAWK
jgi:uncharacterized LabA/DUF88 family protein